MRLIDLPCAVSPSSCPVCRVTCISTNLRAAAQLSINRKSQSVLPFYYRVISTQRSVKDMKIQQLGPSPTTVGDQKSNSPRRAVKASERAK